MESSLVVGVDIGGESTKIGIVNREGEILSSNTIKSNSFNSYLPFMECLSKTVKELIEKVGGRDKIEGIGVGAPNGNYYSGVIEKAVNLSWGEGRSLPFRESLESLTALPVSLTNDANAAAMGEMIYGAAKGMRDFIMITLGSGVGSGIVSNGELIYGHDGYAGELGHTIAIKGGRECNCGRNGCLECYASANGMVRTAKEWLEESKSSSSLRSVKELTSKEIYLAAKEGDKMAIELFNYTGTILGASLADFVAFSAPEAIILFGGLAQAKEFIVKPTVESMNKNLLFLWSGKIKILLSQLKESDAAILGASALAWRG